jgi:hypothetical protein
VNKNQSQTKQASIKTSVKSNLTKPNKIENNYQRQLCLVMTMEKVHINISDKTLSEACENPFPEQDNTVDSEAKCHGVAHRLNGRTI